ncbi:MAG TPA: NADH:flavin oxidoreductase, partial [Methanoregula sp.]|nr:NADH:flavin oxidoreductase [Methanoregula sp.]
RLLIEIAREMRRSTGRAYPILVKINCSDFEEGDGVWEACQAACRQLAEEGISAIEISGGVSGTPMPSPGVPYTESFFRTYAAEIARTTKVPVILVGLNRSPGILTELLNSTDIAYFSFARPFMRQPDLARFWKKNPDESATCLSCDACRKQPEGNVCPFREDPVRPSCMLE